MRNAPYYWLRLRSLPRGVVRRITRRSAREYPLMESFFRRRCGLEIGGPSAMFCAGHLVPVYDRCRKIDNCNFSSHTMWDAGRPDPEAGFRFERQFLAEATDLSQVGDESYDFVLASHVLEHVANPLRALEEWRRVLRQGGAMLVVVPDRRANFDHRRPPTRLAHLEEDFRRGTSEDDLTHLEEILALHDLALDPDAGSYAQFRRRCLDNASLRAMHHHVLVPETLVEMLSAVRTKVLSVSIEPPCHIIAFAQRVSAVQFEAAQEENLRLLAANAAWRKHDPLA